MQALFNHHVTAQVRRIGATESFRFQRFDFMLDPSDPPEQRKKEAVRILRQIGFDSNGVTVEERR